MYEDIKTACLYVRFSSHNQTEQSIEGQTRVCQEFCQRHNIKIVEIYADRATSASKNTERRVEENHVMAKRGFNQAVVEWLADTRPATGTLYHGALAAFRYEIQQLGGERGAFPVPEVDIQMLLRRLERKAHQQHSAAVVNMSAAHAAIHAEHSVH